MISTVIFDIGMVMIDFDWKAYIHRLFNDADTEKALTAATWDNKPAWNELDLGILPYDSVMKIFIRAAADNGVKNPESAVRLIFEHIGECPRRQPYAIPWIEELKSMGLRVFYLSNYFEKLRVTGAAALDFIPHMDGGIFSYEEKIMKPSSEIFQRLCDRYCIIPSEALFIDDSPVNIAGARKFGLNAKLFESYETNYSEIMNLIEDNEE